MDSLNFLLNKLRQPESVMQRPPEPEWKPDYERVGGHALENVSPEDFIPNPKSLVMALKGAPMVAAGVLKSMNPTEFLRLAAPFGHQGGRKMDPAIVKYHVDNPGMPGAYLSVKDTPLGLQVATHDGRHRAVAAQQTGRPFEVDIRKSKRMEREQPELTEDDLIKMITAQGALRPEY